MLEREGIEIGEERSSRKAPLSAAEVERLLSSVETVVIARGRRADVRPAEEVGPDELRGRSGNFRAPMVRRGKTLLVGFHPAALTTLF